MLCVCRSLLLLPCPGSHDCDRLKLMMEHTLGASNPPWTLHKKQGNIKYPTTRNYPTTQPSIFDQIPASLGKGQHALLIEQPIQARITLSSLTDKTLQGLVFSSQAGWERTKSGRIQWPARETVKNSPE